jgi:exo-1,4-beta-D-glucosaminidase
MDYEAKVPSWYFYTPSKQYADFSDLKKLHKIKLSHSITQDSDKDHFIFNVELENVNKEIAFFIELKIVDKETGLSILPVIWSDNYVSLLPKEKKIFSAKIRKDLIKDKKIEFKFKGWNVDM